MSQADLVPVAPEPTPEVTVAKPKPVLSRVAVVVLLAFLMGYIMLQMQTLWAEWRALRRELTKARENTVVGYLSINPNPSYAASPKNWLREEGDSVLLWSGWKPGVGHGWFKVNRGDLDPAHISPPMGRDVVQAIDWPVVEVGGGTRWERIPWDAPVAGVVVDDTPCVYPLLILKKVEVINDEIRQRPLLVVFTPFVPDEEAVNVFDPKIDGHRLTMGLSGYFRDRKPVLYDRGTESLWIEHDHELVSIAGQLKGSKLQNVAHPDLLTWSKWRAKHPQSRLLIGADRSKGIPPE
jgi:hypothetical protein